VKQVWVRDYTRYPVGDGDETKVWYPLGLGMRMMMNFSMGMDMWYWNSSPPRLVAIHRE